MRKFGRVVTETTYVALDIEGDPVGRFTFGHCPDDGQWHVWDAGDPSSRSIARFTSRKEAAARAKHEAEDLITIRERG